MTALLAVARQLVGTACGVAFVAAGEVSASINWEMPISAVLDLWRWAERTEGTVLTRPSHVVIAQRTPEGRLRGALVFDGTPEVMARVDALQGLLGVLLALSEDEGRDGAASMTGYERWLLSANPKMEMIAALKACDWNVSALVDRWEISRPVIYRAIKKYGISLNRAPVAARRAARRSI